MTWQNWLSFIGMLSWLEADYLVRRIAADLRR